MGIALFDQKETPVMHLFPLENLQLCFYSFDYLKQVATFTKHMLWRSLSKSVSLCFS